MDTLHIQYRKSLLPILILLVLLCAALAYFHPIAGIAALAVSAAALICVGVYLVRVNRNTETALNTILDENRTVAGILLRSVSVPCALFDGEGRIRWRNPSFSELSSAGNITRLLPAVSPEDPPLSFLYEADGRAFEVRSIGLDTESGRHMTFQCWLDRTEAAHYQRLYEEQRPTVCLIYVDNFEDLNPDQFKRASILAEVERKIVEWIGEMGGVYRRYETARYFVVFENIRMEEIEKKKFSLLEIVRNLNIGNEIPITLSIAAGIAPRITDADQYARQAMELALGRGGDQAVLKHGANFRFFGGRRQASGGRQSKVKVRLFAKALKQLLENSAEVFILGHRQPDMDCVGAALGLLRCAKNAYCKGYYILERSNPGIDEILSLLRGNPDYENALISPEQARMLIKPSSVLLIVDTQRWNSTAMPDWENYTNRLVLIDHHRKSVGAIESATISYLEPNSSSVCEMVTEVIQCFDDQLRLNSLESGAMLAGITVDTKSFAFNAGARTFEAASFLRRCGADSAMIKRMFQDDMETYIQRSEVVRRAVFIATSVALSTCPEDMENTSIIAAQAADALISIKGIHASFVLARYGDDIQVSGRSIGNINVQMVLEKIGGGGHLTVAGAQLRGIAMDDAVAMVRQSVLSYLSEEDDLL